MKKIATINYTANVFLDENRENAEEIHNKFVQACELKHILEEIRKEIDFEFTDNEYVTIESELTVCGVKENVLS